MTWIGLAVVLAILAVAIWVLFTIRSLHRDRQRWMDD